MPMIMAMIIITVIIKWHSPTREQVLLFPQTTPPLIHSYILSHDFTEYVWYQECKFVLAKVKTTMPTEA
jgi:hypothetical protein